MAKKVHNAILKRESFGLAIES